MLSQDTLSMFDDIPKKIVGLSIPTSSQNNNIEKTQHLK